MKHIVLIVISLISSIVFNSKYITDFNNLVKQTLKLEDEHTYTLTITLYTLMIYCISCIIDYIAIDRYGKNLKSKNKELENQVTELRKLLTEHSVESFKIIDKIYLLNNIQNNNTNVINVIDEFSNYMGDFINNHSSCVNINFTKIFTQYNKPSMDTVKKSNNANKL